jgi:hypothetical protein
MSSLGNICQNSDPKNIQGSFSIKNLSDQTLEIRVLPLRSNSYSFSFISEQRVLRPNEDTNVHFTGAFFAEGKQQVIAQVSLVRADGSVVATHEVDLYYLITNGRAQASSYDALYLQPDVVDQVIGNSFSAAGDDGKIARGREYQQPLPSVQRMVTLDPQSIFRIPTDSATPKPCPTGPCNCPNLVTNVPDPSCQAGPTLRNMPKELSRPPQTSSNLLGGPVVSGVFSYKGMDNLLHPAFGWRVRAWRNFPLIGWTNVAEDFIQFDGTWTLNVPNVPGQIKFQYIASNRFFAPMNSAGETYRWVGPAHDTSSSSFNEGSWSADTSSGGVRGLGEIYSQGMFLWSKLYWEGEINPLRDNPVKVFFPNTTYDCGDGTGSPWSCAATDGRIWLIPAHAIRNGVIQHELSHQINYQFWGNNLPPGAGGSHNLSSCYNRGLALIEGFADFMVFWTQAGRGDDPSTNFDFRAEDPSSFACSTSLATNESWVAATFWDLHDTRADGADDIWFIHPGATPGIFLRQGRLDGMDDFRNVYRAKANAEHRSIIDAVFQQNKIVN